MMEHLGFYEKKRNDKEFMKIETSSDNLGNYIYSENEEGQNCLALIPIEEGVRVATIREFKDRWRSWKLVRVGLLPSKGSLIQLIEKHPQVILNY